MQQRSVIVGTAGHIDHGKTALVKALTGIDADRLEEEKRRGITIDIGFAHLELPDAEGGVVRFGFVDVPGHERFVRNMLAGIGGIDLVLLVIAADEGIKPQTREHFDICRLLGISRGITVLTKADRVTPEKLAETREQARNFLHGSFLDETRSPIISVSALHGYGLGELRRASVKIATQIASRDPDAVLRLPIDRVFTMKGFGTVVTGTLASGHICAGDEVQALPSGRHMRVRGVQVHNAPVESAQAGERTALNVSGVQPHDLSRGQTLAVPGMFHAASLLDARIDLLTDAPRLKAGSRFHLHSFSAAVIATLLRFDPVTGFGRLALADPLLLFPGDRFILRQFSPLVTIGGGVVLDSSPIKKVAAEEGARFLRIMDSADKTARFFARVERRGAIGLALAEAIAETGSTPEVIGNMALALSQKNKIERLQDIFVADTHLRGLEQGLLDRLRAFHDENPLAPGIAREALRKNSGARLEVFNAAIARLVRDRGAEESADLIKLAGRAITLQDDEADARRTIETAFQSAGLKVPALKDVLGSLKLDKVRAHKIVTLLLREGVLIKIGDDLVFHRSALQDLRGIIRGYKAKSPTIDVFRFKDLTQVSRKYAIPLLEFLDRERVTRRQGDVRVIL